MPIRSLSVVCLSPLSAGLDQDDRVRRQMVCVSKEDPFQNGKKGSDGGFRELQKKPISRRGKMPKTWTKWYTELKKDKESSNGDNSFGSTSARSFASMITDIDRNNESITNGMVFDLSAINGPQNNNQNTIVNNDMEKEMLEMRTVVKRQSELLKTQAELISSLTTKMEQMAKQTDGNDQNRYGPSAMALEQPEATQAITDRVALLDERTITLDERTLKMMEMMSLLLEGRNKRDQEPIDHEQDASSLGPAI